MNSASASSSTSGHRLGAVAWFCAIAATMALLAAVVNQRQMRTDPSASSPMRETSRPTDAETAEGTEAGIMSPNYWVQVGEAAGR
jgi:hypothetical protein